MIMGSSRHSWTAAGWQLADGTERVPGRELISPLAQHNSTFQRYWAAGMIYMIMMVSKVQPGTSRACTSFQKKSETRCSTLLILSTWLANHDHPRGWPLHVGAVSQFRYAVRDRDKRWKNNGITTATL